MAHNTSTHNSTANLKEEMDQVKKDIEMLAKRLSSLQEKGGDVISDQIDELFETLSDLKDKGEKKGKEMMHELTASTKQHPIRNLAYALGAGVVLSLLLSK